MTRSLYTDAHLYALYEELGVAARVAEEVGLSYSVVSRRLREYREAMGLPPATLRSPRQGGVEQFQNRSGTVPEPESAREPSVLTSRARNVAFGEPPSDDPSDDESARESDATPAEDPRRRRRRQVHPRVHPRTPDETVVAALVRIEHKLNLLLKRPPTLVEWRPDHRRLADGGSQVTDQRREVALPKRHRRETP